MSLHDDIRDALDAYGLTWPWQQRVIDKFLERANGPDPLDELLEAAGIPTEQSTRVVARRDGHDVVTPGRDPYERYRSVAYGTWSWGDPPVWDPEATGLMRPPTPRGPSASAVMVDDPIKEP